MNDLHVSVRASAVSLAVSGFVVAAGVPWHPSIFDRPVDEVVRGFGAWTAMHTIGVFMVILALIGAVGLVAVHEGRLGRLGQAGLIVTLVGVVGVAGLPAVEAIVFPVLADRAPELLALDGPLLTSRLFIGAGLLALGWPLGLAMLGIAAARAGVFHRAPGVLRTGLPYPGRTLRTRRRSAVRGGLRSSPGVVGLADVAYCRRAQADRQLMQRSVPARMPKKGL